MKGRSSLFRRLATEAGAFWVYACHLWALFALALSNAFLGLALLVAPWIGRRRVDWSRFAPALVPLGLYCLSLLGAIALSHRPLESLPEARELASMAALPLGLLLLRDETRVRRIVDGLIALAALTALVGLGQLILGSGDAVNRIRGPFSHYMTFAGVLVLADLLVIAQLAFPAALRGGMWKWPAVVAINLALAATLTRSAWVGLFVAFVVLLLLRAPRYLALFLPAAVLAVALSPAPVRSRVLSTFDLHDVTNYDRLCMLDAGLRMTAHNPLFGLGPEMVDELYPFYRHPTAPQQTVPHLHNSMLQLTAERGLLALAAYLWLMAGAMAPALRGFRSALRRRAGPVDLYLGVFVALLAFNIAGLFEDNWSDTEVQRVALFLIAAVHALRAMPSAGGARRNAEPTGSPSDAAAARAAPDLD